MTRRVLLLPVAALLLLVGCGVDEATTPGTGETDRVARVVSDAIGYPRQESAMDYARAAANTSAGEDGRLTVVGVDELEAEDLEDPLAELTYRVFEEGSESGLFRAEPVTACYQARFSYYGLIGPPDRIRCPSGAAAVSIPDLAPPVLVTERDQRAVGRLLRSIPDGVDETQTRSQLVAVLAGGRGESAPDVEVAELDGELGVAVRGDEDCLLALRSDGEVALWRPSSVQLQPGELGCGTDTALAGAGQTSPH